MPGRNNTINYGFVPSFTYTYNNATDNITRITTANGEYTDYTYDILDRLTCEEKKTQAGQRIYKIEYLFDNNDAKNGNIHQVIVNETDTTTFPKKS
jgi:YD repeat-containing protein